MVSRRDCDAALGAFFGEGDSGLGAFGAAGFWLFCNRGAGAPLLPAEAWRSWVNDGRWGILATVEPW